MMDEVNRGEKRSTLRFKLVCKGFRPFIEEARFRPRRYEGKWFGAVQKVFYRVFLKFESLPRPFL